MSQWLAKGYASHGVEVQLLPDPETDSYFVGQLKIDDFGRHVGGVIDIAPNFTLENDEHIGRRSVAAFALRVVNVDSVHVAEVLDTGYRNAEYLSRRACLALGADRRFDAGLAQATAAAFRTGLFKLKPGMLTTNSNYSLTDWFEYYSDQPPKINLTEYMHDIQQPATRLSTRIERLWRQKDHAWFPEHLGVCNRTDLMLQWQLEQRRLAKP